MLGIFRILLWLVSKTAGHPQCPPVLYRRPRIAHPWTSRWSEQATEKMESGRLEAPTLQAYICLYNCFSDERGNFNCLRLASISIPIHSIPGDLCKIGRTYPQNDATTSIFEPVLLILVYTVPCSCGSGVPMNMEIEKLEDLTPEGIQVGMHRSI